MTACNIKSKLKMYISIENVARSVRIASQREINKRYYEATREGNEYKEDLLNELIPLIDRYLNSSNSCSCEYSSPDDVEVQPEGVWVFFDADHPNDRYDYVIPYEELYAYAE